MVNVSTSSTSTGATVPVPGSMARTASTTSTSVCRNGSVAVAEDTASTRKVPSGWYAACARHSDCANQLSIFRRCHCEEGMCGKDCAQSDPCQVNPNVCLNGGICVEDCDRERRYYCNCTGGYTGVNCSEQVCQRMYHHQHHSRTRSVRGRQH